MRASWKIVQVSPILHDKQKQNTKNKAQISGRIAAMLQVQFVQLINTKGDRGGTVVKVLCYKSEGRWFDRRRCHWNFSLT